MDGPLSITNDAVKELGSRSGLDELNRLGATHGIRFFNDWIPDLKAAYNLRLIGE
jgi:hypothetical protein